MFDFDDDEFSTDPLSFQSDEYDELKLTELFESLPIEDAHLLRLNAPHPSDWKDDKITSIAVTVDKARSDVFNQADKEISFIKNKINTILGTDKPSLTELANYIFGKESDVFNLFQRKFLQHKISHETFCKCIGWFLLSCQYSEEDEELREMFGHLSPPSVKEYKLFWSEINRCNLYEDINNRTNPTTPLWRQIENVINELIKELFINEFPGQKIVTIDDDKVFFQATKTPFHFEPKQTQHVKDNRRGPVIDTAGYTATGIPIGFRCQGFRDDTASNTEKLINNQFAATDVHISISFDRGYSIWPMLNYVIGRGAILGVATEHRSHWFPFCYDQKLGPNDEHQDIVSNGPKAIYSKHYDLKVRESEVVKLSAMTYRNGNGGVILGMTSDPDSVLTNGQFKMDIVLKELNDYRWYNSNDVDVLNRKWFDPIICNYLNSCDDENIECIVGLTSIIQPVTTSANNPSWFVGQCYSCTSSTTDCIIVYVTLPEVKQLLQDASVSFKESAQYFKIVESYFLYHCFIYLG